jgi:pyruvate/2-oxoglutarate dehydrogenase complex dihydrolipoamide acyltransferase (E2) component
MTFTQFWTAYEQVVRKSRTGSVTAEDHAGTTISLTNPGGISTNHSVPRLTTGKSAIIGVGARNTLSNSRAPASRPSARLRVRPLGTPASPTSARCRRNPLALTLVARRRRTA